MNNLSISPKAFWSTIGLAMLCAAVPGSAQGSPEEIIVTGRYGVPESVQSLSQTVSYADLDLSTDAGKRELRHRVKLTARFLCEKLGETNTASTSGIPSCRDAAVGDALKRVGTLEAGFAPRGTTWARGPAWKAPYPETWVKKYPDE